MIRFRIVAAMLLSGCATVNYTPPIAQPVSNTIVINMPRDPFWKVYLPALSQHFFVINNLDKETGLINLSYNGDPERFIDCGRLVVDSPAGEYTFAGASASQNYKVVNGVAIGYIHRRVTLEGRANIIVQDRSENQSAITVNTRYAVARHITVRDAQGRSASHQDSIGFNYGENASFPMLGDAKHALTCRATGEFETSILNIAKQLSAP